MEKIEQDRHISSHDIDKELNIDHKIVLKPFGEDWIQKKFSIWVPYDIIVKMFTNFFGDPSKIEKARCIGKI